MSLKKLVTRVRKHFSGSIAVRRVIWIKAQPPLLCGFCLNVSGLERGVFRPMPIIIPTYIREESVSLSYALWDLMPADGSGTWYFDEKDPDRIVPDLVSKLAGAGLQFLNENGRDISSFLRYVATIYPPPVTDPHALLAIGCGLALIGELDAGIRALAPLLEPEFAADESEWVRAVSQQGREATAAMRTAEASIRSLLDGWSQESLIALGIAGSTEER
jgi:hypothetical protein